MPTTLRVRTGFCESDAGPPSRRGAGDRRAAPPPLPPAAGFDARLDAKHRCVLNSLAGWIGVAIALSIALYACEFATTRGTGDSVVTSWVAGAVGALAVIPCVLFAVSAHRDMRKCWAPVVALALPALLGTNLILSGL
jgi:hypothetical protein